MKRLLSAFTFLAVVHLLALLMFAGWLWQSGRLDAQRLQRIRDMLSMTTEEQEAFEAQQAVEAQHRREQMEAEARRLNPPLPSAEQVRYTTTLTEQTEQSLRRLRDETEQLRAEQDIRAAQLDQRAAELEAKHQAWEQSTAAEAERRSNEQLQKTVKQYESAPPKVAKEWIMELVRQGDQEQVVAYLDGMNPRAASRILREFSTDEEAKLATELLERLRTFGVVSGTTP